MYATSATTHSTLITTATRIFIRININPDNIYILIYFIYHIFYPEIFFNFIIFMLMIFEIYIYIKSQCKYVLVVTIFSPHSVTVLCLMLLYHTKGKWANTYIYYIEKWKKKCERNKKKHQKIEALKHWVRISWCAVTNT